MNGTSAVEPTINPSHPVRRRAPRGSRGLTLAELLPIIAIIATLIGSLLPAVQRVREAAARAECVNTLRSVQITIEQFRERFGRLPATLQELVDAGLLPEDFADGEVGRFLVELIITGEAGGGDHSFVLVGTPVEPGISGDCTCVLTEDNELRTCVPLKDAPGSREKMFADLRAEAAGITAVLLNLDPTGAAHGQVRDFVSDDATIRLAFDLLDLNRNGVVTLAEIMEADLSYLPRGDDLNSLLAFIRERMMLGLFDENLEQIGVELGDLTDDPAGPLFTFEGIRELTRHFVVDPEAATSLLVKLNAAEAAHNEKTKQQILRAYVNQLRALSGKAIAPEDARTLAILVRTL